MTRIHSFEQSDILLSRVIRQIGDELPGSLPLVSGNLYDSSYVSISLCPITFTTDTMNTLVSILDYNGLWLTRYHIEPSFISGESSALYISLTVTEKGKLS